MAKKPRGAGDLVASVTSALGIQPKEDCGCKENQAWLNQRINFVNTIGGCMNEEQVIIYEDLTDRYFTNTKGKTSVKIPHDDIKLIMNLYNSIHGTNVKGCSGCNMNIYWDKITKVYNSLKK